DRAGLTAPFCPYSCARPTWISVVARAARRSHCRSGRIGARLGRLMLQGWIVIVVALGYIGLLFVVASYGDRIRARRRGGRLRMLIYPLSLSIYCTSWTFFG